MMWNPATSFLSNISPEPHPASLILATNVALMFKHRSSVLEEVRRVGRYENSLCLEVLEVRATQNFLLEASTKRLISETIRRFLMRKNSVRD